MPLLRVVCISLSPAGRPDATPSVFERTRAAHDGLDGRPQRQLGDRDGLPGLERAIAGETDDDRPDAVLPSRGPSEGILAAADEHLGKQLGVAAAVTALADRDLHLAR